MEFGLPSGTSEVNVYTGELIVWVPETGNSTFYDITHINFSRKVRHTTDVVDTTGPHPKNEETLHQPPAADNNISQNPENASNTDGVRHSIAPKEEFERVGEGGFRRADPRKVELWAKYIVKIANSTYINPDAAAALLMDQGIRVDGKQ